MARHVRYSVPVALRLAPPQAARLDAAAARYGSDRTTVIRRLIDRFISDEGQIAEPASSIPEDIRAQVLEALSGLPGRTLIAEALDDPPTRERVRRIVREELAAGG